MGAIRINIRNSVIIWAKFNFFWPFYFTYRDENHLHVDEILSLRGSVRHWTLPTERPPLVGELSATFSGQRSPRQLISVF
jgi:hypothetical protein